MKSHLTVGFYLLTVHTSLLVMRRGRRLKPSASGSLEPLLLDIYFLDCYFKSFARKYEDVAFKIQEYERFREAYISRFNPIPAAALKTGALPHYFRAGIYFPTAIAPQLSIRTAILLKCDPTWKYHYFCYLPSSSPAKFFSLAHLQLGMLAE